MLIGLPTLFRREASRTQTLVALDDSPNQTLLARGYVAKLLGNAGVVRWLSHNRQEYLAEFQRIAEIDTLAAGTELVLP